MMRPLRREDGLEREQPSLEGASPTAAEALARLERIIEQKLGPLRAGVVPLLAETRGHIAALEPGPGGARLPPKERQERQAKLLKALQQLEDILEALYLSVRAEHRSGAGKEE
jgi:hypothetical protein